MTDTRGRNPNWISVPDDGSGTLKELRTSGNQFAVLSKKSVRLYSKNGAYLSQRPLDPKVSSIAISGNQFLSLRERKLALDWVTGQQLSTLALAPSASLRNATLDIFGGQPLIAEQGTGRVWILNLSGTTTNSYTLRAPEINGVVRVTTPNTDAVIMGTVAVDGPYLWARISPYSPARGAIVLRFRAADGLLANRLLCILPQFQELDDPRVKLGGYLTPSFMAVRRAELFIVSRANNKCSYYDVSKIRAEQLRILKILLICVCFTIMTGRSIVTGTGGRL